MIERAQKGHFDDKVSQLSLPLPFGCIWHSAACRSRLPLPPFTSRRFWRPNGNPITQFTLWLGRCAPRTPPLNAFKIRTHNYVHNFLKRAASVFLPTRRQGAAQFRWPWLIFIRSFQHAKAVAA